MILAAGYMLWMVQRVFYGELSNPKNQGLPDLSAREATVLLPLVVLAIVMGDREPVFTRRSSRRRTRWCARSRDSDAAELRACRSAPAGTPAPRRRGGAR